jgi:hypothetical protein
MTTTTARPEKDIDDQTTCDESWCEGVETEPLPCFACFELRVREFSEETV